MCQKDKTTLPEFDSIKELIEFFDNNDLGDHLESMEVVDFDVVAKRRQEGY